MARQLLRQVAGETSPLQRGFVCPGRPSHARANIPGVWKTLQTLWEKLLEPRPLVGDFLSWLVRELAAATKFPGHSASRQSYAVAV
jgi:hypothetical protein